MRESLDLPNIPEYVSIKEAAKLLGISDKRVYAYIEDGRLPAMRAAHVIMIPVEEIKRFKPKISGRPRKNTPIWRTSPENNIQLATSIIVRIRKGQQELLRQKLEEMKVAQEHIFPGTIARYIVGSKTHSKNVEILLFWRSTALPDEETREKALNAFQQSMADVFDWNTAVYDDSEVYLHT